MLKNYFKIGFRNLTRSKGYSAINIGGLSIGMCVAILIGLWVYDELSFNRYHKNYDRIAQMMKTGIEEDGTPWAGGFSLAYPLVNELRSNYSSNFTHIVEALQPGEHILTAGSNKLMAMGQFMATGAPEMLTLDMIHGTRRGLKDPYSLLLCESTARNLFGNVDPVGKIMTINSDVSVMVTGVYRDIPHNNQFHYLKFIAPWELAMILNPWISNQNWKNHFLHIYCEIAPGKTFDQVMTNIGPSLSRAIQGAPDLQELINQKPKITLVPMEDWHLRSSFSWPNRGRADTGPARFVWLVGIIGVFVLILACINFMNLSTARSEKRAREVGIRKSMGSLRHQLICQFFAESYVVVLFASVLSLLLAYVALPLFNQLSAKEISFPWSNGWFWLFTCAFILITGLLSGSYPALYLSSFNPIKTLKGTFRTGKLASLPRKVLVVVQFAVSVTLIISTIVVYKQITYAKDRPVGYTRDGLLLIQKKSADFYGKTEVLRSELKRSGMVEEIAESGGKVTGVWSNNSGFTWEGKDPALEENFGTLGVSVEYGRTIGWQFIDGRDFSDAIASDSSAVVINESAARIMGMPNIVGQSLHWKNENWRTDKDFHVVGVIRDMVMNSPFKSALPTIFLLRPSLHVINVRIRPGVNTAVALDTIEKIFTKVIPSAPFDFEFADEAYGQKFAAENKIASLASVFSVLAIFISCLGLFGLASFVAEQRTKEIGIRKVIGATIYNLWTMLSIDFVVMVIISGVISIPLAWFGLSSWLEQYEYRIVMSWWIFALSITGAVVVTIATVSFQAIRVARMNPAQSLRSE